MARLHMFFHVICLTLNPASFVAAGDVGFYYSGFSGGGNSSLVMDGDARITGDGYLELTNGENSKGHALFPSPVRFKRSPNGAVQSFSSAFVFGIVSARTDGMAFFITPSKSLSGTTPEQYMGLIYSRDDNKSSNHMFAVELDIVKNQEVQDIDNNHVGIDINSLNSLRSNHAAFYDDRDGGALKNLNLSDCKMMRVWVEYSREATQINVTIAPREVATKPSRPLISVVKDLSPVLTEQAYVGFSAGTGPFSSSFYVLGWSFAMNAAAPDFEISKSAKLPACPGHDTFPKILEIALPIAVIILATCLAVILLVQRRRKFAELREDWEVEFGPHRLAYKDLFMATEGFKNKHVLGVGGFGKVYKGVLPTSGLEVAVKRVSHDSSQGMKEFVSEVVSIGRLRHRNIVQLLGYCRRKGELLLVYDYMPNGSLDRYLHGGEDKPTLDWARRFEIIKGVASGLFYLHERWEKVVIHRDVKASNVLLDGEMNGRLGDFGLARLYDHGADPQTTRVVGTIGYLAPELACNGVASPLTDVFSFGVFLLEVTCGRRPVSGGAQHGRELLVDWVLEHWHGGSLLEAVDPRLRGGHGAAEACLALRLGLMCSHPLPSVRPAMRQVLQYLDGDMPLPELTQANLSFSLLAIMQNQHSMDQTWSQSSFSTRTELTQADLSGGR